MPCGFAEAQDVLVFWFRPQARQKWFSSDRDFDLDITVRFSGLVESAARGECDGWLESPRTALALVILLDQFPRNIHRGTAKAFAQDEHARTITGGAIERGHDMKLSEIERRWFYMPLMHSENIADQRLSLRYFGERLSEKEGKTYAREHHDVIARFARFPHRNAILLRENTPAETEYLKSSGGWGQKP